MANELPEVSPVVQSMPTEGWFYQTSGSARRRVSKNKGTELNGIFDVAGVPGHTHNSSAVVSIDADYSTYRNTEIERPAGVWSYDPLVLPAGLLMDSEEPDHQDERYDRCIEKCVGYISLFPENCTGHIREPARSISEIRTLVAPKARLDTLTYLEERRGWVVPVDADDEDYDRDLLVSDFPDIYIDVRPLGAVLPNSIEITASDVPGSLYIESSDDYFRVHGPEDGSANIGTLADGTAWDGTLRFVWDEEERLYRTLQPVTVILNDVRKVIIKEGYVYPIYDLEAGADPVENHATRLTVQFAVLKTTPALDGYCWLGRLDSEEALHYADKKTGLLIAPKLDIEVVGIKDDAGPFSWRGTPAYRIPVGSKYAHPAPGLLNENLYYNHWDKFDAFAQSQTAPLKNGFLVNQFKDQAADLAYETALAANNAAPAPDPGDAAAVAAKAVLVNNLAVAIANQTPDTFDLASRQNSRNSGMFYKRPSGLLGQLTSAHYDDQPNFGADLRTQYATAYLAGEPPAPSIITPGLARTVYDKEGYTNVAALEAIIAAAPAAAQAETQTLLLGQAAYTTAVGEQDAAQAAITAASDAIHQGQIALAAAIAAGIGPAADGANPTAYDVAAGAIHLGEQELDAATAAYAAATADILAAEALIVGSYNALQAGVQGLADAEIAAIAATQPFTYVQEHDESSGLVYGQGEQGASVFQGPTNQSLAGTTSFSFVDAAFVAALPDVFTTDQFCAVPCTPLYYQSLILQVDTANRTNFHEEPLRVGKGNGEDLKHVCRAICNVSSITGNTMNVDYDFTDVLITDTSSTILDLDDYVNEQIGSAIVLQGYTLWLPPEAGGGGTSLVAEHFPAANGGTNAAQVRAHFQAVFATGNKFLVPAAEWTVRAVGGHAGMIVLDTLFALSRRDDFGGFYFETCNSVPDTPLGSRIMWFCPKIPKCRILYEQAAGVQTNARVATEPMPVYYYRPDLGGVHLAAGDALDIIDDEDLNMYILGPDWYKAHVGDDPYAAVREDSNSRGAVFQSIKRISQHVCAPVLNPNMRIGTQAPLNYDSRHLPPELRDFRLQMQDIDWSRLQAGRVTLNEVTLYEFRGGNQKQGAEQNVLYLPEFREFKTTVTDNTFEFDCYSNLGSPSYYCFFCRSSTTDILQQPKIKTLSIFNKTTQKKSDSVQNASIGQLYHLTQRNVHPAAEHDRRAASRRQCVLLSAEDVGLMGLKAHEYQRAKRINYLFSGTTDRPGDLYVIFVYNNRGLHIDGRRLQLVTLHE